MDRLTSMAVFLKAADLGSFTAAGTALGLSSQMVGKHVSFLENRLGTQLLQRSTRRQSLTAIGRTFYERCRVVLAEVDAAEATARESGITPRGRLRVGAPVTFGSIALAPLVTDFLRIHPQVEVALDLTDRYVDVVGEGYDAVIRLGPLKDSKLTSRALAPYKLIACASPGYLAARGAPRTPADLSEHDCLGFVFASGQPFAEWSFDKQGKVYEVQVRSRFQVNDARVLQSAALDGQGIILQADLIVADDLAAGRLVQVLPDYETPTRPMHILFAATRPPTQTLRRFIDHVVDRFGKRSGPGKHQPSRGT
ncbi:LysR family transcriptional regulator [Hansschlegelia plantiphila]|uniref:LysR family transcriptional regulator n=1 Tax=Hansschlegelia plantiphila TaxID=374655 RepID=A0A9W6J1D3_9HYPH|nr:LysR family transcriptional regulator [Hansschlegelia plantiphila]GLK67475.1 LysR family transcriptional regulator [Hansschlegelia plantiphila]